LAIIEITPDFPSSTTTDRLLDSIRARPDGVTIKELSDTLNRPVSMIHICLKILIASKKVAIEQHKNGRQLAKVYVPKSELMPSPRQFQLLASGGSGRLTPIELREVAGLTKVQLASELGLSVRMINDWEQNRSQPKLVPSQLKLMMSVYQCTLDELIAAFE
jgi:DNA-binding XRE family transcriptional regulator